jgi:hypothetical protein
MRAILLEARQLAPWFRISKSVDSTVPCDRRQAASSPGPADEEPKGPSPMPEGAIPHRRDRQRLPAAERRLLIMEATEEVISERGFWGLSLQDVADRCGLSDRPQTLALQIMAMMDGLQLQWLRSPATVDLVAAWEAAAEALFAQHTSRPRPS